MSNGITWMFSEKGGYLPASSHAEIAEYTKSGFVPCGNPVDHKNGMANKLQNKHEKFIDYQMASAVIDKLADKLDAEVLNEISREELIKLADESNIKIDKRWNIDKLKQALGL